MTQDLSPGFLPLAPSPLRARPTHRPDLPRAVRAFIALSRPKFLLNSWLLVILGTACAVHAGFLVDWRMLLLAQGFAWCSHLATTYCSEYFDLAADLSRSHNTRWTGGSGVLTTGALNPAVSLAAGFLLLFVDLLLIVLMPYWPVRLAALAGIFLGWFYSAPPLRLNYRRLGEIACALALNGIVPVVAEGLQTGRLSTPLLACCAIMLTAQIFRMLVMNLSDRSSDLRVGKHTLAGVLGDRGSGTAYAAGQTVVYLGAGALCAAGYVPLLSFLLLLPTTALAAVTARRITARPAAGDAAAWASTHMLSVVYALNLGIVLTDAGPTCGVLTALFTLAFAALLLRERARRRRPTDSD